VPVFFSLLVLVLVASLGSCVYQYEGTRPQTSGDGGIIVVVAACVYFVCRGRWVEVADDLSASACCLAPSTSCVICVLPSVFSHSRGVWGVD
jgi:hypothetical protein